MECQRCKSERVASISGKCSNSCFVHLGERSHDGYAPTDMGLKNSFGDYVEFSYCLDCGQIQGSFPVPETDLETGDLE